MLPAQERPQAARDQENGHRLAVTRVVLYKNGVGYFEHLGHVRDKQDVGIEFTSGQLNDVLKSLTVLDLSGGRITNIGYGSSAPIDRQLGDLNLSIGEKTSLSEFLGALRGARLEVKGPGGAVTGRLLSVERKTRISGGTTLEVDYLTLMTDAGELKTTEVTPQFSVRLLDRGLTGKVDRYLDLVNSERESDVRKMVISTDGSGERSLYVSYISEVPVWKSTYRIVLDSKKAQKPLLQGWAIVDNVVGQDWTNVHLSLVAGAPQSFIQQLSQPYYARRPEVGLPQNVAAAPQTYQATLVGGDAVVTGVVRDPSGAVVAHATVKGFDANGSLVGETAADAFGSYTLHLPDGGARIEVNSPGFNTWSNGLIASSSKATQQDVILSVGSTAETMNVIATAPGVQTSSSQVSKSSRALGSGGQMGQFNRLEQYSSLSRSPDRFTRADGTHMGTASANGYGVGGGVGGGVYRIDEARLRAEAAAQAQQIGELFEYKVKEPITIPRNRSALVPIVQSPITAEKVSVWSEAEGLPHPRRAIWLTNSTGLTLDGGTFSVLEDETFAGEGIFNPIRPDEKRLVSFASDLAVHASTQHSESQQPITRVRISKGILTHEREIRESKTYIFRNTDSASRSIIIEHPVRAGYKLRNGLEPVESTADYYRLKLEVPAKKTASLVVEEGRPIENTYMVTNINSDIIAGFVQQKTINHEIEVALRHVLDQKDVIAEVEAQKEKRESEAEKIFDDQQRIRENMKALKGTPEEKALVQRYTQQLNNQETRLAKLQEEEEELEKRMDAEHEKLNTMIQDMTFDVKL